MDLSKLVTLLESAQTGSEYLDYSIQRVLFGMTKPVPLYTRSLDAAMTLMPAGWSIHRLAQLSDCRGGFAGWIGDIYRGSDAVIPYPASGTAASAPLALCLAAARARYGESLQRDDLARAEPMKRSGTL